MELFLHNTEHESNLCKSVVTYLEKEEYSDVTFICKGGKKVKAHKVRLSCDSPFLKRLFAERHGYDEMTIVMLPDVDHTILKLVLDFLYEGTMKLSGKELEEFKDLLTMLDIRCPDAVVDERPSQSLPSKPPPPVTKLDRAHKNQFTTQKKTISHSIPAVTNKESVPAAVTNDIPASASNIPRTSQQMEDAADKRSRDPVDDPLDVPDFYFVPPVGQGHPVGTVNNAGFATGALSEQNSGYMQTMLTTGQPGPVTNAVNQTNTDSRSQGIGGARKRTFNMTTENERTVDDASEMMYGRRNTRKQIPNETSSNMTPSTTDLNAVNSRKSRARRT